MEGCLKWWGVSVTCFRYHTVEELRCIFKDNKILWENNNTSIKCQFVYQFPFDGQLQKEQVIYGGVYGLVKIPIKSKFVKFFTRSTQKLMWKVIAEAAVIQISGYNQPFVLDEELPVVYLKKGFWTLKTASYMPWLIKFNKKQYEKALENLRVK